MKRTKQYLKILLLLLLPTAIFADQPTTSDPQPVVSIASMDDISHYDHQSHQSATSWLKNNQIKQILLKAQNDGKLGYVMNQLDSRNLPKSLALIPVIESKYTPGANSNKGASGIWQLMPATAKRFGISTSQRYQLAPSTTAALTYFKALHQKFGSWELAIAAYNAGEGRIQQALNKKPGCTNVQQLSLPQETKQYVQRFYMLEDYIAQNGDPTSINV